MTNWPIFSKNQQPHDGINRLPLAPPWRRFGKKESSVANFLVDDRTVDLVNAALFLRRPLLVKGKPGTGKSSLAYAVAKQLKLGTVLVWPITSRSTIQEALYRYDAIGRLQDFNYRKALLEINQPQDKQVVANLEEQIGQFIRLGPLGTALLPSKHPRVLLIDEFDKSDIDLPNDLLYIFEEGRYEIPELSRIANTMPQVDVYMHDSQDKVSIPKGMVECQEFPFVVITSNDERDLPPAFLRRCLTLEMQEPNPKKLAEIVRAHFAELPTDLDLMQQIDKFVAQRGQGYVATDQLLNVIYMLTQHVKLDVPFVENEEEGIADDEQEMEIRTLRNYLQKPLSTRDNG